jgi:hypothetical protein
MVTEMTSLSLVGIFIIYQILWDKIIFNFTSNFQVSRLVELRLIIKLFHRWGKVNNLIKKRWQANSATWLNASGKNRKNCTHGGNNGCCCMATTSFFF